MAYATKEDMLDALLWRHTPCAYRKFLTLAHRAGTSAEIIKMLAKPQFAPVAVWWEDTPKPSGRTFAGSVIGHTEHPDYAMMHPASRFMRWEKEPESGQKPPLPGQLVARPTDDRIERGVHPEQIDHMLS